MKGKPISKIFDLTFLSHCIVGSLLVLLSVILIGYTREIAELFLGSPYEEEMSPPVNMMKIH